jgi:hypothetical protein
VPTIFTPTVFTDGVSGGGQVNTLRDAVLAANQDSGTDTDTIQLAAGTYTLTIRNTGGHHETAGLEGDLNITNTNHQLIIQGAGSSGPNATIIDASQLQDRVFDIVNSGTQVVFRDLVIQGGLAQDDGSNGALAGSTDALGGGILNNGGNDTLDHVVLQNNVARGGDAASLSAAGHNARGGGFYSTGGALTLAGATIASNQAIGGRGGDHNGGIPGGEGGWAGGGGLYASGGSLDISASRIASNQAIGGRGGDGITVITPSGSAVGNGGLGGRGQGGGLYMNGGSLTIGSSTIASDQAAGGSGGAFGVAGPGGGGGLYSDGTLTVSNSTLSGNSATGSLSFGAGGGGISNIYGTLTVSNSTLSGNFAGAGGGIANWWGTLTVSNSTLSGNSANADFYGGGGIYNLNGTLTVSNSTLTANRADGNGGGLYVYVGSSVLHNTVIAGNFRGATGTTRDDVAGALDPGGDYNLIGDGTGMTGLSNGVNGNLVGSSTAPIDPLLGPLQDNGGPTFTHALLPGSPAIDAGNNAYATNFDQRGPGFPRIVNGIIDIGAFEVQAATKATHYSISAPASAVAGSAFNVTVKVLSDSGNPVSGYTGTVHFRSSDGQAILPSDYTFTSDDAGVHTFTVTLKSAGTQSITAMDTVGGFTDSTTVVVTPASVASPAQTIGQSSPPALPDANSLLGRLQNNGGMTPTMALLAGNPALNAGDLNQRGTADQRGETGVGGVNLGAYPASASTFVFPAPAMATAGMPFDRTVKAVDPFGQAAFGYSSTVTFRSTDSDSGVILPADYLFMAADGGTPIFRDAFTLLTPGGETFTATDRVNGLSGRATAHP